MEHAGNEWRWKRHSSVTFKENRWYRHSQKMGSYAIDFMQEFFGMTFPEAVCYLLNGEQGEVIHGKSYQDFMSEQKSSSNRKQKNGAAPQSITEKESNINTKSSTNIRNSIDRSSINKNNTNRETSIDTRKKKKVEESKEPLPPKKPLVIPEKNKDMKRVYAYLMQKRFISREVLSFFARKGTLYECSDHHNIVFAGTDQNGNIRHVHKKGTYSDGGSFRINEEGSNPAYGFGYTGKSNKLYVFEAPIDFLSFLTLFPKDWQDNSYVVLNGVAEHAILQKLQDYPYLDAVILCLDHDPAGIEACGRIKEILMKGIYEGETPVRTTPLTVKMLQSIYKDWNEDLKARNSVYAIPAQEHPKIKECASWIEVMKEVCRNMNIQYATKESLIRYYRGIYEELKDGLTKESVDAAFDGEALLLSGIAIKCVERYGKCMRKDTNSDAILEHLKKCYQPHKDKGNIKTKIRNLQQSFEAVMAVMEEKDKIEIITNPKEKETAQTEYLEEASRKCMSLAMECVRAHIFCACEEFLPVKTIKNTPEPVMKGGMVCSQ